jgi:hypothetical protein
MAVPGELPSADRNQIYRFRADFDANFHSSGTVYAIHPMFQDRASAPCFRLHNHPYDGVGNSAETNQQAGYLFRRL